MENYSSFSVFSIFYENTEHRLQTESSERDIKEILKPLPADHQLIKEVSWLSLHAENERWGHLATIIGDFLFIVYTFPISTYMLSYFRSYLT